MREGGKPASGSNAIGGQPSPLTGDRSKKMAQRLLRSTLTLFSHSCQIECTCEEVQGLLEKSSTEKNDDFGDGLQEDNLGEQAQP